jgi:hypothetical protein
MAFFTRRDSRRDLSATVGSAENNRIFPGYAIDGWEHQVENLTEAEQALRNATDVGMNIRGAHVQSPR